ncbi:hypothetical protein ACFQRC_07665 [Enterovirga sp. GCM10030262]|uniref:hypothetical protein n=1 Tax=Enterovirga sp. GCM10030262 TaxID=3273391 RepID=UPI0036132956
MPRALRVYRLPIGFHDAYVAAPTQKAAIEAWGSDKDVFQRGQAELVTDAELTKEPLENPGKVIKRLRGTAAEQIAALAETPAPASKRSAPRRKPGGRTGPQRSPGNDNEKPARPARAKAPPKPKPRPSRANLDEAEQARAEAEARNEAAVKDLREREAALARERKALEKEQDKERERLEARREKAQAAYEAALRRWRES